MKMGGMVKGEVCRVRRGSGWEATVGSDRGDRCGQRLVAWSSAARCNGNGLDTVEGAVAVLRQSEWLAAALGDEVK